MKARGFTLLELLLVVAIIGVAAAGVAFALRDATQSQLDQDAQRLAALLESARAQSRANATSVRWHATTDGFQFEGLPSPKDGAPLPRTWLHPGIQAQGDTLLLGPEPLLPPQAVRLWKQSQPERSLWVATDGVRPFAVRSNAP